MFHEAARKTYDCAICMYHDQALIPIKTLAFDDAVNVTLGLPFIRTSPDHGTAFDIAGTGTRQSVKPDRRAAGSPRGWRRRTTGMSAIDDLPPLREVIRQHALSARKSLGQNFLLDLNLTARIARAAGPLEEPPSIEIGPGPGGLTRALLALGARRVIAVERDERALPALEHREPPVGLIVLARDDAFGDLALKHQHHHVVPGRPRLDRQPVDQQGGRDIVRQVGDDFCFAAVEQGRGSKAARRRGRSPAVPDNVSRYNRARQGRARRAQWRSRAARRAPAAPASIRRDRADLDHGGIFERTCGARDPRREIEIEQEILAERFARRQAVFANDVAQRRQVVDRRSSLIRRGHAAPRAAAPRSGSTDWPCRCRQYRMPCRDRARCG